MTSDSTSAHLIDKVSQYFTTCFDRSCSEFVAGVSPLGHGAVLSYPDRPNLKWSYKDYIGNEINRNNLVDYNDAVQKIYIAMKRFKESDYEAQVEGLNKKDLEKILELFETFDDSDEDDRHKRWLERIKEGFFSFGPEDVEYPESMKRAALGEMKENNKYELSKNFFNSDWKMFHDVLRDHHYFLNRRLFPEYGLCIT